MTRYLTFVREALNKSLGRRDEGFCGMGCAKGGNANATAGGAVPSTGRCDPEAGRRCAKPIPVQAWHPLLPDPVPRALVSRFWEPVHCTLGIAGLVTICVAPCDHPGFTTTYSAEDLCGASLRSLAILQQG
ncbi:MAG TPA: hypothetical protein VJ734_03250 [Nitrosospira sp.]|nr:hypothetical protein [Nitrosospira sp.]